LVNNEYIISGIILTGIISALILIPIFASDKVIFIDDSTSGNFTDTTVCLNVGTGKLIIKSSTNGDCEIKSLIGSADINITNDTNTIIIDYNGTIQGESSQCINVGSGKVVIKNSTSGNCFVKTFVSGNGISITNGTDTITITNTITTLDSLSDVNSPSPSTGDVLTFDATEWKDWSLVNLGLGPTVYKGFTSDQFQFRSLVQGSGIIISSGANDLTIQSICNNTGSGEPICENLNNINSLIAGTGITITDTTGDLTIANTSPDKTIVCGLELTCTTNSTHVTIDDDTVPAQACYIFQSVTKTNLPNTYTDIYTVAFDAENFCNGAGFFGATQFQISWMTDFIGAGDDDYRWVDANNNNNVLFEFLNRSLDCDVCNSDWTNLPAWAIGDDITNIEMQAKSSNGTNDPIIKGYVIYLK
jgi:hypothetical protein